MKHSPSHTLSLYQYLQGACTAGSRQAPTLVIELNIYMCNVGRQANDWQKQLDEILDTLIALKAVAGVQSHLSHAALWAPFPPPKKSVGSASLAAMRDTNFRKHVAEAMGAPEDICMVLNKRLPPSYVCGGRIVPVKQV